mmetsp:Transcript_5746/g.17607  ORF Transcript_5746/g.17607 Transcript_5746/m.17607 type:complete len:283 (-) Transcript_5746:87-935(-)
MRSVHLPHRSVVAHLYTDGAVEVEHLAAALQSAQLRAQPARIVVREEAALCRAVGPRDRQSETVARLEGGRIVQRDLGMHAPLHQCGDRSARLRSRGGQCAQHTNRCILQSGITVIAEAVVEGLPAVVELRVLLRGECVQGGVHHLPHHVRIVAVVHRHRADTRRVRALVVVLSVHEETQIGVHIRSDRRVHAVVVGLEIVGEEHVQLSAHHHHGDTVLVGTDRHRTNTKIIMDPMTFCSAVANSNVANVKPAHKGARIGGIGGRDRLNIISASIHLGQHST